MLASVTCVHMKLLLHESLLLVPEAPSWHILGMNNDEKQRPVGSGKGHAAKLARDERSARALRDNLRRRKMQVRERTDDGNIGGKSTNDSPNPSDDSADDLA